MAGKRTLQRTLISSYVYLTRRLGGLLSHHRRSSNHPSFQKTFSLISQEKHAGRGRSQAVVCRVEGGLLRSPSTFPYFMLVALEAGGFLRGLLLLLLYPCLCCVGEEVGLKVMAMVCFRGVKVAGFRVGSTVLPKHLLEDVGLEGFQLLTAAGGKKVCVTGMPRVMVEAALKEYLGVEVVVGRELKVSGGYYTGFMENSKEEERMLQELGGEEGDHGDGESVLWVGGGKEAHHHHPFFSERKEEYTVSEEDRKAWRPLPRDKYLKPLVFHDGRIAFLPTPAATLAMFLWLPVGLLLAVLRLLVLSLLPYKISVPILAFTGTTNRVVRSAFTPVTSDRGGESQGRPRRRWLFACNHRTLLDPVYVSGALGIPLTVVTYSLSPVSEVIAPIKTVRLTREREEDRRRMEEELRRGDVVVCPEGTTCREPYLLRFSPLFSEVAEEGVTPVALRARMAMFYGTTAGGRKWMDPIFFAIDPFPSYTVEFLREVPVLEADGTRRSRYEVANQVQAELAAALGFECTTLTRKDKYMQLAGNEGFVDRKS
ncbi:hypothetical protein Taro_054793 [Colocasia esculenta]|uniref:Phospholipid/glycerol acyltransferase domain-containing protein n=1 Tax=Colocasia esculenta TaxID=4460 RepID=A0A843XPE6_COLES|nr:hypothetical protein [Colocasia esculenta]